MHTSSGVYFACFLEVGCDGVCPQDMLNPIGAVCFTAWFASLVVSHLRGGTRECGVVSLDPPSPVLATVMGPGCLVSFIAMFETLSALDNFPMFRFAEDCSQLPTIRNKYPQNV